MKKIMSFTFIGVFFVTVFASCGASKNRCDAYGDNYNNTPVEQTSDIAHR